MSNIKVYIPDLSGANDVDVVEVLVKAGDKVNEGDSLIVLETDKASMEVPAPQGGTIAQIQINEGDQVNEGDLLLEMTGSSEVEAASTQDAAPVEATLTVAAANTNVYIPDLSGATDVDVVEVLVKVGDKVNEGDSLIVLETDKASMEVPAPQGGTVTQIRINAGDQVNEGDLLLEMTGSSEVEAASSTPAHATPASAIQEAAIHTVYIPDLSGATDVDVVEVLVKVGDKVDEGDSLIVLETDKASMEVPAPQGGTVTQIRINAGDQVNEGDLLLEMTGSAAVEATPVKETSVAPSVTAPDSGAKPQPAPAANTAATVDKQELEKRNKLIHAGPAVRAIARKFGVELDAVTGSGRKGRILKEDVQSYVKNILTQLPKQTASSTVIGGSGIPAIPEVDFSQFGEIELEKLTKIQRVTRDNMSRCWLNVPHVTQFDKADITDLERFRNEIKEEAAQEGVKLTPLPFMLKAITAALKTYPKFNTSLHADGEHLVHKKYINIGMAVDTPNGLMVPVIKDADKKSIYELSKEAAELAGKAKDRKLKPIEMQGACFTISSLGGIGGTGFTPIVNAPEVAILGVSKADIEPRWNGKEFEPRKMLPLCLSYDHRVINGGDAGKFLTFLNALLSDIRKLVL